MSDAVQIIVAIMGFLTACVVSVRVLGAWWFKQQRDVHRTVTRAHELALEGLKSETISLKDTIRSHSKKLSDFESEVQALVIKFSENQQKGQAVLESLKQFVDQTNNKFMKIDKKLEEYYGSVVLKK